MWRVTGCLVVGCGSTGALPELDAGVDTAADAWVAPETGTVDAGSRCLVDSTGVTCASESLTMSDGIVGRTITYQVPLGAPPAAGWPAVLSFQGSFLPGHAAFSAAPSAAFGMYQMTLTIRALLDGGYAVLAPDAQDDGNLYWETNIPPYATSWSGCPDDVLMHAILEGISAGSFGPLDPTHLYAMGISSGGFMTSRMAVSYPGTFRALADVAGSYATCGPTCFVPTPLPSNHPPILFLHGDQDTIVPASSLEPYFDALTNEGLPTQRITDPNAGHEWLAAGVTAIPAWFH